MLIKYRRRGIGTMLMDKSEEIIRERSKVSGLGMGLFSDYGAAQSLAIEVIDERLTLSGESEIQNIGEDGTGCIRAQLWRIVPRIGFSGY